MRTETTLPTPDVDVWGPEHDQPINLTLSVDGEVALAMLKQTERYASVYREAFDRTTAELIAAGFTLTAVAS